MTDFSLKNRAICLANSTESHNVLLIHNSVSTLDPSAMMRINVLCTDCSDIDAYYFRFVEVDFIYYDLGASNQGFPSQGMNQPVNDKHRYELWNAVYIVAISDDSSPTSNAFQTRTQ